MPTPGKGALVTGASEAPPDPAPPDLTPCGPVQTPPSTSPPRPSKALFASSSPCSRPFPAFTSPPFPEACARCFWGGRVQMPCAYPLGALGLGYVLPPSGFHCLLCDRIGEASSVVGLEPHLAPRPHSPSSLSSPGVAPPRGLLCYRSPHSLPSPH